TASRSAAASDLPAYAPAKTDPSHWRPPSWVGSSKGAHDQSNATLVEAAQLRARLCASQET
ncbi:MAG: hypothetical protein OXB91_01860, partial [Bryobacterales bacterium]|nr:hypothetical protein [Bryobacterales bacterium]